MGLAAALDLCMECLVDAPLIRHLVGDGVAPAHTTRAEPLEVERVNAANGGIPFVDVEFIRPSRCCGSPAYENAPTRCQGSTSAGVSQMRSNSAARIFVRFVIQRSDDALVALLSQVVDPLERRLVLVAGVGPG